MVELRRYMYAICGLLTCKSTVTKYSDTPPPLDPILKLYKPGTKLFESDTLGPHLRIGMIGEGGGREVGERSKKINSVILHLF